MRLRIRSYRQNQILPLAMGIGGLIIIAIALPSWIRWLLFGAGLVIGAWILLSRIK
ncbi:MAG TPA: hypothetical protein GX524_08905 [Firmicutes bacterium]|nr:hypothetical protein [Bacillota bacterium]